MSWKHTTRLVTHPSPYFFDTNILAKVALKNFIDDFAIYAVEQELLVKVQTIFTPATIFTLREDLIHDIAGETEDAIVERASSTAKLATLKKALDVLKRLDRGHTHGKFDLYFTTHSRLTYHPVPFQTPTKAHTAVTIDLS